MGTSGCTVGTVKGEILAAIAEVRAVAESEDDAARERASDWLEALFAEVDDRRALREASARALEQYRGGAGSFGDVGTAASAAAVSRLRAALRGGRSWFVRA